MHELLLSNKEREINEWSISYFVLIEMKILLINESTTINHVQWWCLISQWDTHYKPRTSLFEMRWHAKISQLVCNHIFFIIYVIILCWIFLLKFNDLNSVAQIMHGQAKLDSIGYRIYWKNIRSYANNNQ